MFRVPASLSPAGIMVWPIILPSLIGVGLFGPALFCDEFVRSSPVMGEFNSLPLEVPAMTTHVISPILYAPGTARACSALDLIGLCLQVS